MVKEVSTAGIDKNNKMVIRPLGAIYKTGVGGNLISLSTVNLTSRIAAIMAIAKGRVFRLSSSCVSIRKPKSIKNKVRIRKAASAVSSFSLLTSEIKLSGLIKDKGFKVLISSTFLKKSPNNRIKMSAGK